MSTTESSVFAGVLHWIEAYNNQHQEYPSNEQIESVIWEILNLLIHHDQIDHEVAVLMFPSIRDQALAFVRGEAYVTVLELCCPIGDVSRN